MSSLTGYAIHPVNQSQEPIYEGFAWVCLLFGCFWFLAKGMWGWAVISFLLAFCTCGLSWLVIPFFANDLHTKSLWSKGYLSETQATEQAKERERRNAIPVAVPTSISSVADEIAKLAHLRSTGALTDEEFAVQKARLLRDR